MSSEAFDSKLEEAMAEMLGAVKGSTIEGIARSLRADKVEKAGASSSTAVGKTSEPKPQNKCAICGSKADLKCRTCKSTCYCSSPCQATDWYVSANESASGNWANIYPAFQEASQDDV